MKFLKQLVLLVLPIMMLACTAWNTSDERVFTYNDFIREVEEEVKLRMELLNYIKDVSPTDAELLDLKIDRAANEKLGVIIANQDRLQSRHDALISHYLTIITIVIAFMTAIVDVIIPIILNRRDREITLLMEKSADRARRAADDAVGQLRNIRIYFTE